MDDAPRINARLDDESSAHLRYLVDATGKATSVLVRESLAHYYRHVKSQKKGLVHFGPLIGKGDSGRSDIASNWKKYLGESLDEKYRLAPMKPRRK